MELVGSVVNPWSASLPTWIAMVILKEVALQATDQCRDLRSKWTLVATLCCWGYHLQVIFLLGFLGRSFLMIFDVFHAS